MQRAEHLCTNVAHFAAETLPAYQFCQRSLARSVMIIRTKIGLLEAEATSAATQDAIFKGAHQILDGALSGSSSKLKGVLHPN